MAGLVQPESSVTDDRKLMEDDIWHSEALMVEVQRLAHTGSWAFYPSGSYHFWSQELFRIYGLDQAKGAPHLKNIWGPFTRKTASLWQEP